MEAATSTGDTITPEWCAHRFDHLSPQLGRELYETLEYMRANHPVAHSEKYGGFWVLTKYEDVLRVAQDWETFSSAHGITVPAHPVAVPAIPEMTDPPLHREFKRLINYWFRPPVVLQQEKAARGIVTRLINEFIEAGSCDFMEAFARPFPGLVFFELFLHAPGDEVGDVNRLATTASLPGTPQAREARGAMLRWIGEFVEERRKAPRRDDVVDAILHAEIEGRPITPEEVVGVIQLLLFGGLDTTSGTLGHLMIRFCQEPKIPKLLHERPELVPPAVEELLRLDGPFVFIARTAMRDTEIGGRAVKKGEKVLISWISANRDESEFACPATFKVDREANRHLGFGAGPHRCAGSNLARMNLRLAVGELARRLGDIRLPDAEEQIRFHSGFNRSPVTLPIAFTPGPREGAPIVAAVGK